MIKPIVVLKAFDKFKVGSVMGVVKSGKDVLYQVVTEDGKIYDNVKIDYSDLDLDVKFQGPFAEAGLEF